MLLKYVTFAKDEGRHFFFRGAISLIHRPLIPQPLHLGTEFTDQFIIDLNLIVDHLDKKLTFLEFFINSHPEHAW